MKPRPVLLDTNVLGAFCHPRRRDSAEVALVEVLLADDMHIVCIPEIADYELRRELMRLAIDAKRPTMKSLTRLDQLVAMLSYLPLTTDVMRLAAGMWASARSSGKPTADRKALDGDVILAAQATSVGGIVLTTNRRHLEPLVELYPFPTVG